MTHGTPEGGLGLDPFGPGIDERTFAPGFLEPEWHLPPAKQRPFRAARLQGGANCEDLLGRRDVVPLEWGWFRQLQGLVAELPIGEEGEPAAHSCLDC